MDKEISSTDSGCVSQEKQKKTEPRKGVGSKIKSIFAPKTFLKQIFGKKKTSAAFELPEVHEPHLQTIRRTLPARTTRPKLPPRPSFIINENNEKVRPECVPIADTPEPSIENETCLLSEINRLKEELRREKTTRLELENLILTLSSN